MFDDQLLVDTARAQSTDSIRDARQLEREGLEILKAVTIEGSSSNSKENVLRGTAELVVLPELANEATTWYLADCTGAMKPLIWQLRQSPSLVAKNGPQDDQRYWQQCQHSD